MSDDKEPSLLDRKQPGLLERMVNLDNLRQAYEASLPNESHAAINYIAALEDEAKRVGIMFDHKEEETDGTDQ